MILVDYVKYEGRRAQLDTHEYDKFYCFLFLTATIINNLPQLYSFQHQQKHRLKQHLIGYSLPDSYTRQSTCSELRDDDSWKYSLVEVVISSLISE